MVSRSDALHVLRKSIIDTSSAFMRNVVWESGLTCRSCAGALKGWPQCFACHEHNFIDLHGFLTYARDGHQTGRTMYTYKAPVPGPSFRVVTEVLTYAAVAHWGCIDGRASSPPQGWTTVPSLSGRDGVHPLEQIAANFLGPISKVTVIPSSGVSSPRGFEPDNFRVVGAVPAHVIVLDDSWVSGGHIQSVAAVLKAAGADYVTSLCVARWLKPGLGNTDEIMTLLTQPFDPDICPYTGQLC